FPWKNIPAPPAVPVTPQPQPPVVAEFWDQCQHQSWYFLPWHRGYLLALEAQIRAAVIASGGPSTWALPYWNYLGPGNEAQIPPAFTATDLPNNGGPNPLFVQARYGPNRDGNVFVPIPPVSSASLTDDIFVGGENSIPPGFGGPVTGFSHNGDTNGGLENNPHNLVHVFVGEVSPDSTIPGLMSDPGLAALDPIFYLHHANIDRMWAVWNKNPDFTNPADPNWLNGPAAAGGRKFVMPMPDGTAWTYIPQQMTSLSQLDYTYDELPDPPAAGDVLAGRLNRLGVAAAAANVRRETKTELQNVELVGASPTGIAIKPSGTATSVQLDPSARQRVSASLAAAAETEAPDRVFLKLDNVRGNYDSAVLSVYINLPDGANPKDHPELLAGSVGLFGLHSASRSEGRHGGRGLSFSLDISRIVDSLHLGNALNVESLPVSIIPHRALPDRARITIGRLSMYRLGR
ncbi:MAG TPA: tyrosinase family protein, partial [Nitrospira sp.]|nr:tyrosinase family protein [Nitrospira sp.]